MERRLAAILLTDMVGYSRLIGLDEEGTITRQRSHRAEIFDPKISDHGGRIVKSTGDGLLAEFPSVVDAVKCAVEAQRVVDENEGDISADRRIRYRIGVNLGDIVVDGDDILGDGVNVAARLEALADPGGVCISGAAYDQLAGKLDLPFENGGEHTVKNLPRPLLVWRWKSEPHTRDQGIQAIASSAVPSADDLKIEQPSVAVLPFANLSPDPNQEFFADGLVDDIINTLSKISRMRVIARHSTFAYKGKSVDVRDIAKDLSVRYVLEGSVRRAGDRLRVTAQLVDTKDGGHLWADRFDRQVEDLFDIQDEVTKEVVTALQFELTVGEEARVLARGTDNIEAWQYCVRAIGLQYRFTATHHIEARKLAEKAVELDPRYAYAWSILGFSYFREARLDTSGDRLLRLKRAAEISEKAMSLDSSVSWVVGLSALVAAGMGEHEKSVEIATQSLEMQPGNADIRANAALAFAFSGRFEDAIEQVGIAISLNPRAPTWYRAALVRSLALSGSYEEAIRVAQEMLRAEPKHFPARFFLTYALQRLGREAEARNSIAALHRSVPHFRTSHIEGFLTMPDHELIERVVEALRQAGLPDADAPGHASRPSLAVLPFENLSSDPEQEFLADGMAEDIIAGLSKFRWLFVIARRSTFTYKGQTKDIREIADELSVRYVVEGSIRRSGNRIRVTSQLIDAENSNHIWSDRYDRELVDIFAVQDDVSEAIIRELAPEISHMEIARARRTPPESLDAWGLYQKALALHPSGSAEDFDAAIALLDQAHLIDPNFVDALAMAAYMKLRKVYFFGQGTGDATLHEVRKLLNKATRLDSNNSICHSAMGRLHAFRGEHGLGEKACRKAIELNPNSVLAHVDMAAVLTGQKRSEEALQEWDAVEELSPTDPHMAAVHAGRARSLFRLARYEECADQASAASNSPNPRYWADAILVAALTMLGKTSEAEAAKKVLLRRKPDFTLATIEQTHGLDFGEMTDALIRAGLPT